MTRIVRAAVPFAAVSLLLVPALAPAQAKQKAPAAEREPGVYWEHTVSMEMAGFSMPGQTSKICKPRSNWSEPPGPEDKDCRVYDVRRSGSTMTWKMDCTGKEKMSGDGEMTWAGESYTGRIRMKTADGEMLMKMKGRSLGQECDAGEMKRTVAAVQAQAEEAQVRGAAAACDAGVKNMMGMYFVGANAPCKDPAKKAEMCARLGTREGYTQAAMQAEPQRRDLAQACGRDLATYLPPNCASAAREEARNRCSSGPLDFITRYCESETRAVAQRECAGRDYTSVAEACRSFCVKYGKDLMKQPEKKPPAQPPSPKKEAEDAAKKAVKGVFGF